MRIEGVGPVGAVGASGAGGTASAVGTGVRPVSGSGRVGGIGGAAEAGVLPTGTAGAVSGAGTGGAAATMSEAKERAAVDKSALDQMVEGLNRALQAVDRRLQFLVHDTTGRIYVKVINQETEEVIREIPPEKILDLVGHIHQLVGLIIDEKV